MEHPNATMAREAIEAMQAGDITKIYEALHPDVVWTNDLAAGPWAGTVTGRDQVLTMFGEFMEFFEGTFSQELHDVMATDDHIVELFHERGTKNGLAFDNRAAYVLHVTDGKVTEAWTLDVDRDAAVAFWQAVGTGG